ncbi:hypothetical protein [Paenibacillus chitinolyticus]|uniref:hypothetical protein n=1 Tax=Paenibacillus chitinolyticus TaxID=79263 RepID=UPI0012EB996A|nr:hypothetical protein [Paenibacillus chitinolyticus]
MPTNKEGSPFFIFNLKPVSISFSSTGPTSPKISRNCDDTDRQRRAKFLPVSSISRFHTAFRTCSQAGDSPNAATMAEVPTTIRFSMGCVDKQNVRFHETVLHGFLKDSHEDRSEDVSVLKPAHVVLPNVIK